MKPSELKPAGWAITRRRLLLLAFGGLLCVGLAGLYLSCTFRRSIGSGPAGPAVPREAFLKPWASKRVLLVGLGDSVTAGFGARKGYSYFDRLVANPPDELADLRDVSLSAAFPNLVATNLAVSGSVSLHLLEQQLPLLGRADSNTIGWVVITTGGNDLIHNYGKAPAREHAMYGASWAQAEPWIQSFSTRLERILEELDGRFPGGHQVFLANIYDPTDGAGDIQKAGLPPWPDGMKILNAYNEIIARAVERRDNVHLVDIHSAFLGHGIHCGQPWSAHFRSQDPHYWYYHNLEDPNERGYDAIRRLFLNEMIKVSITLSEAHSQ